VPLTEKRVLILGGGVAGATAGLRLAEEGIGVIIVEQDDFIGGYGAQLACKALESCQKCNGCLVEPGLADILNHPNVEILRRSRLVQASRSGDGYEVKLVQQPAYIDPEKCTACGLCLAKCPAAGEGAIRQALSPVDRPRLAINPEVCLYFKDQKSTLCREVCPEEAIRFDLSPQEISLKVEAIILATGFKPYPAENKTRYGYGRVPNVVTGLELEAQLRHEGRITRPSDGKEPKRVAFIQCVGSRDRTGNNYCSRVCCGYALRLGRMLKHRFGAEVSLFYMDFQSFGHDFDRFLASAREELETIRSMPGDVMAGPEGQVEVHYQPEPGKELICRPFDLLVLSVGLTPGQANPELADQLALELDPHGFIQAAAKGEGAGQGNGSGIFLAGTVVRPMDMAEVAAHAGRAAVETLAYLEGS